MVNTTIWPLSQHTLHCTVHTAALLSQMIYSTPHWSNLDLGDTLVHRLVESGIVPTAFHLQDGWWYRLLFFFSFLLKRSSLSDGSEWLWWHHFINQTTPSEVLLPFYRMSPVDVAVWCSSTDILGLDQACCPVWLLKHYCYRGCALGGLAEGCGGGYWHSLVLCFQTSPVLKNRSGKTNTEL